MEILIPTCNQYMKYVEALQLSSRGILDNYQFKILGYEEPKFKLDKNFEFISLGEQLGPNYWSNDIIKFLQNYPHSHFIYGSDDCALINLDIFLFLESMRLVQENPKVGRFGLTKDGHNRSYRVINRNEFYDLCEFDQGTDYRLSLSWSIYSKDFFLQFCKEGMTPWEFEKSSCDGINSKSDTSDWKIWSYGKKFVLSAAYFRRKHIEGVVDDWYKSYFNDELTGVLKERVRRIIFKEDGENILEN